MSVLLICDNIRSIHNVGAFYRTAECLGVEQIYLCGITPHLQVEDDERLPHQIQKLAADLHKTALGAETVVAWRYFSSTKDAIAAARAGGYTIVALEQSDRSKPLHTYRPARSIALVVGPEVTGIDANTLAACDEVIEIPMYGQKESLNVSVATGIALYDLTTKQRQ